MPKKLFLIDAHAICYRTFYAIPELLNSKGQPTNAIYGFVKILNRIISELKPDYMAVCFDSKKKTIRQEKYAQYKIQRPKMPDNLISQMPYIKDVIQAFNIPIFELGGYEADDLLATIVHQLKGEDLEILIISEDKDLYQLAENNVKFYSSKKNEILDYAKVQEKLGFDPKMMCDFIGLAGDQSDNIPGVKGIGKVRAIQLLNKFGSLEEVFKNIDKVDGKKVKEYLENDKENAFLSKDLAVLYTDVPYHCQLPQMIMTKSDDDRLLELYRELEFRDLVKSFSIEDVKIDKVDIIELTASDDFEALNNEISKNGKFAYIINKDSQDIFSTTDVFVSVFKGKVYKFNIESFDKLNFSMLDNSICKITYEAKDSFKFIKNLTYLTSSNYFDVKIADYLLSPSKSSYYIQDVIWENLNKTIKDFNAGLITAQLIELHSVLENKLKTKELYKLFTDIEMPLSYVIFILEATGVKLDLELLAQLSEATDKQINKLVLKLMEIAGEEFNLNSPKQLGKILFEKLNLPVMKKTKTGFSTDESVLSKLAEMHDFPKLILEYRQINKLKNTYIDVLPKMCDPATNRIFASFNQTITETGRLSSNNPNLQNIPIRTELGREIRKAFIATDKDHVLMKADYSQIELRILAHLSCDESMINAFRNNEDIHSFTASLIFEIDEKDVTSEMRDSAKRVNFGIVYGMSAFGLSKDLKISQYEAQDFIDRYFLRYPKVKEFMDRTIEQCERDGFVKTLLNRTRSIPEINSSNFSVKQFAQRQAINTPVQGSAADLIKMAMIDIQKAFEEKNFKSKMIITVHDELVFDVLKDELQDVYKLVKDKMENTLELSVPIKVSIKTGDNWIETKEIL